METKVHGTHKQLDKYLYEIEIHYYKTRIVIMHRTRVSPNKDSSAMLFGQKCQGGGQNAQCSKASKLFRTKANQKHEHQSDNPKT